ADISSRLGAILHGERPASHTPKDRRTLLPLTPVDRQASAGKVATPGHGDHATGTDHPDTALDYVHEDGPADDNTLSTIAPPNRAPMRRRLDDSATAPLKLASGCDRRCSFCAI